MRPAEKTNQSSMAKFYYLMWVFSISHRNLSLGALRCNKNRPFREKRVFKINESDILNWRIDIFGKESRMALRIGVVILGLVYIIYPNNSASGYSPVLQPPQLRSAAFMVQDLSTGECLLAKRADIPMPIASITKLMTAMVVLDARLNMEDPITIGEQDKDMLRHSHSHLPVGACLSRHQALLLALMASENRAAYALGRTFPGGVGALVKAMNEKARALALKEAYFVDPTGLSDENVSSAQELGRIVEAASRYPLICEFTTTPEITLQLGRKKVRFANTNPLVRNRHWQITLSKTGYIEEGGRCLVMLTNIAQHKMLIVLLNSSGKNTRIADANRIKQWMERAEKSSQKEIKPKKQKKQKKQKKSSAANRKLTGHAA
jgi:serine-type D-Ala-D-Ala endopeptidase (penicillin-binding protein 7)